MTTSREDNIDNIPYEDPLNTSKLDKNKVDTNHLSVGSTPRGSLFGSD